MPVLMVAGTAISPARPVTRCLAALAVGATVILGLLLLVALLTAGSADAFDLAIIVGVRSYTGETGAIVSLAKGLTAFGNDVTLWTVTLLVAGYLAAARDRAAAARLLATSGLGGLLTATVKSLVERPRPTLVTHLVAVHPPSFPSGHAANSAFVYGTLALIAAERTVDPTARRYVAAAALLLILLIGSSRVVLGVHWPSDVLAGWAIGASWALLAAWIAGRVSPPAGPMR